MSATNSLHYRLCLEGAKWLRSKAGTAPFETRNKYVVSELVCQAGEQVDVWGTNGYNSTIIEVKVSHEDFLRDQKKYWRSKEAEETGHQTGNYRYYLCPADIISPEELPEGWGLLYWTGFYITKVVPAKKLITQNHNDLMYLTSIMTRVNVRHQVFNFRDLSNKRKRKLAESN